MYTITRFDKIPASPDSAVVVHFNVRALDADGPVARLRFYGWALAAEGRAPLTLVVRGGEEAAEYAVAEPRPDVIAAHGGGPDNANSGFHFLHDLKPGLSGLTVHARAGETEQLLAEIALEAAPSEDTISPKALRGRNGFLFLGGADGNMIVDYLTGAKTMTRAALEIHRRNLALIDALPCPHAVLVVPEAHVIYPENLPEAVALSADRPIARLKAAVGDRVWYPVDEMRRMKALGLPVYTGHDTHWTEAAAFRVYAGMRGRLGRDDAMPELAPNLHREVRDLRISSPEEVARRETEARKGPAGWHLTYFAAGILNHGNLVGMGNRQGKGRLLAFGTSFTSRLVPAYAADFADVVFCYSTALDPLMVELVRPDAVVIEMPERFVHFPSLAVPGSALMACLISSRADGYKGPYPDRLEEAGAASDGIRIARGLVVSANEPALLQPALDLLARHDPATAARAANLTAILPGITLPVALRAVVCGLHTNNYVFHAVLTAIDNGELDGAGDDLFPASEMGLLCRARLMQRQGRDALARALFRDSIAAWGRSEHAGLMTGLADESAS